MKLFFRLLLGLILLIVNHNVHAQNNCDAEVSVEVDGSDCSSNGKAKVTIIVTAKEGSTIDLTNTVYGVTQKGGSVSAFNSNNTTQLAQGSGYVAYANNISCGGTTIVRSTSFDVTLGLNIKTAEYKRCTASDITVSVAVLGGSGKGQYIYQLLDGNNGDTQIGENQLSPNSTHSFSAKTSSSNLKIKVTDPGCNNTYVIKELTPSFVIESSIIEGNKSACKGGNINLSVKSAYSGSNLQWKKGNTVISTGRTMTLSNVTEANNGEYTLSMPVDGCDIPYSETFTIDASVPKAPHDTVAHICYNSSEVSLSKYVSKTSNAYTLVWYKADGTLIGETAPKFNPNQTGTTKYLVSQKKSDGCESPKAELQITVENLPAKVTNNYILCTSNDSKPKIRILKAGNHTYNLYTAYSGGTKIGSGTAVKDTAIIETTQDLVVGKQYFVETQNIYGCTSDVRTAIPITIQDSWISGPEKVCFDDNLSLSSNYPGGTNIVWTKPDNSTYKGKALNIAKMQFKDAGVYHLLIEDSGLGCTMRDEIRIAVTQPAPPTVATNSVRYVLNATPAALTATAKNGFTLKWYNPTGNLLNGQSPKPATNEQGVFVYHVSQDSTGCESPKVPVRVIVGTVPSAVPASDINICISEKPTIQIKNTVKDYTYSVYHKNNLIAERKGNDAEISLTSSVAITENADIEITVTDIYGVKSAATKKSVIALAMLIAENPSIVCFNSDFQLVALDISGASYKWTLPDGSKFDSRSISVTNAQSKDAGTYTLTVTTPGCSTSVDIKQSISLTQPVPPTVDKTLYIFAENESATPLVAAPKAGFKLKWYLGNTLLTGQSPVPATDRAGAFMYSVTQDSLGCESARKEITVIVGEIPESVSADDINICIADKPSIQISNTIQDYKYSVYYKNDTIAEGKGNGGVLKLTSGISISENTQLAVTVADTYGISSERTKVNLISVNNLIDLQSSALSVCEGSTGKLVAADIPNANYMWTTPSGSETGSLIIILSASNINVGAYTLAVTAAGCPVAKQTVDFKIERPAKPSATKEIYYCTGDEENTLTATALPGYKLVWFDESHTQLTDAPSPNTSTADTSIYFVLQTSVSDENCFSDLETITVIVEDKPETVVLDPVNVCTIPGNTQPVSVRIPDSSEGYIYSLYSQETGGSLVGYASSAGDGSPVDIAINDADVISGTTYYLEITNQAGCSSDRSPVEIVITEISLSPDELPPYKINEFYSQRLETTAPEPRYEVVQGYLPLGFTLSSMGDISGTATEYADPFTFTVEVSSNIGCSVKKEYTLKSEMLVSKMFSPNGDGINDTFMKGYRVIIFDRNGRKLFNGDDGWDGTYNGKIVPEDVYYYIIYYKDKDGTERKATSYVTIIKTI